MWKKCSQNYDRGASKHVYDIVTGDESLIYTYYRGRISLQDEFREGLPKSIVVPETINAVRQLILEDCHVTYREIKTTLGISGTSIHSILHEYLTVKKICSLWIPHNLSFGQKNQSIRMAKVLRQLPQMHATVYRS